MNAGIIQMLEQLQRLRVEQGLSGKVHGYSRAISNIKKFPEQIVSGEHATTISGVGKSIANHIDEFLRTGRVAELAGTEEKEQVINLFMSVYMVGMETANTWYNAGYRNLTQIPRSICTDAQWIGIQFREEFLQKIPRSEIDEFKSLFNEHATKLNILFEICGSYRRGKTSSGDIDVLIIDQPGRNILSEILTFPYFTHTLAYGTKKYRGVIQLPGKIHRRIDLELVQPYEYPFAVVYFTGPDSFNRKMRTYCEQLGYRLNEKCILDQQGIPRSVQSEEHLFQVLGLVYLTPEEREKY